MCLLPPSVAVFTLMLHIALKHSGNYMYHLFEIQ
jgi:hypothetical protein